MFKRITSLLMLLIATASLQAAEVSKANPYQMIEKVADITFTRFKAEQTDIRKNPNQLKTIVKEELLPYIDYGYAAYKVIGKNFPKTTKPERKAFVKAFRAYLVTAYAQVFTLYTGQKVTFEPAKKITKQRIVAVNTVITEPGRDPINIAFKVRLNRKTKEWKAFDMVAEGVSLLDSKQAELSNVIRQKGLPFVTDLLLKRAKRDVSFDKKDQEQLKQKVAS